MSNFQDDAIEQFDKSDRYILAMRVYFKDRNVTREDVADIGYILDNPPAKPYIFKSSDSENRDINGIPKAEGFHPW